MKIAAARLGGGALNHPNIASIYGVDRPMALSRGPSFRF
jgi:hypothetical protein